MQEPVVVYLSATGRSAPDDDGGSCTFDRVVVDLYPVAGNLGTVASVPAAVHIEYVAVGVLAIDVVACLITFAAPAGGCDGMPAPVEQVCLDERIGLVETNPVSQPGALVVMYVVVMDVRVLGSGLKVDRSMAPAGQFAVVYLEVGMA